MDNEQKKIACPACGKGHLREGGVGYVCDYFVSIEDMCKFVIYREMFGRAMSREEVEALCSGETIGPYTLTRKDGSAYTASLHYAPETQTIAPVFEDNMLEGVSCPRCGGGIRAGVKYYACTNGSKEDPGHVFFGRVIAGVELEDSVAAALVRGELSGYFDFAKKSGEVFTARLRLADGEVKFDASVCKCPACGGTVMVGDKSYYCNNFRGTPPCDFHVFREMGSRAITPEIVASLCRKKETDMMEFQTKDGKSVERKIILNDANKVLLI